MKTLKLFIMVVLSFSTATVTFASKLVSASILDKDYIMLYFHDGDVSFTEGASSGCGLYVQCASANSLTTYGSALNTANAATAGNWKISSNDDQNFGSQGISPSSVYRKSKLCCMAQMAWSTANNDYNYDWAYEHTLFLKLPQSLEQGKSYTIHIPSDINSDLTTKTLTFDIFNSRSEAVKVNIVGYSTANSIKSADVYEWMGDGNSRDYSSFAGKKIYIYNTATQESQEVNTLSLWKAAAGETSNNHQMLQANVWKADFTGFKKQGTYRLAVEDIGCSDDFTISDNIYCEPFKVSTRGYYYMRVGEGNTDVVPIPRHPLFIPEKDPVNCKVYITTITPYDADWSKISANGDPWDNTSTWANYLKPGNPTNPNAWGGHADAFDWDRHLGHVSNIYDMLLPYFITNGALSDDNLGIAESGNGIPDIIDEARYEVDFWLRLRDGMGYSHGLNNPVNQNTNPTFYQAGTDAVAAWANAANAAMLADCFRISGHAELMAEYRDSAIAAYTYASKLPDQMLTKNQDVGNMKMTGKDFRITAAAFLYNLTGETMYENDLNMYSNCKSASSTICNINSYNELYAVAAYLFTNRKVNFPTLYNNMKSSIISEAKSKETNYSNTRPSRRSTDNDTGWFITTINNERTIVAHAISDKGSADKTLFENALILEADFSLGRNPLNMINMTTATTNLANKKSVENMYTSGWNDGTPGVHPGHTPYMNQYDWGGLIMGCPTWMTSKNYPAVGSWPYGELYYNTRYVYAANEYTPQQVMRGKTALYGYLYAISPAKQTVTGDISIDKTDVSDNGKGAFVLSLTTPADVLFSGSFQLLLPTGIQLDSTATKLADDLASQLNLSVEQKTDESWTFTITPIASPNATVAAYSRIIEIGYTVSETLPQGTYEAIIQNLSFDFENGTNITENEIQEEITVNNSHTKITDLPWKTSAYMVNDQLHIDSPDAETIKIYSMSGILLYNLRKPAGKASYPIDKLKSTVMIVKGSSGWVKKVSRD